MKTVAALYIDPRGPYPAMAGVECYGLPERDAKLYDGPWPLVAHPPCGPWGAMRHMCKRQDPACALRAIEQVRRWGGVLEHPAYSRLWAHCELPRPGEVPDVWGGRSIEVEQVRWGHVARKRTWLYLVGVRSIGAIPPSREPTHWVCGSRNPNRRGRGGIVPSGIKVCSAQQRRRTPPAFAEWLVALARSVGATQ